MRNIIFIIPVLLLAACEPMQYNVTTARLDNNHYEMTIIGDPGVAPAELRDYMKKRAEKLCGWPYLVRHTREEQYLVSGRPVPDRNARVHHYGLYAEIECGSGGK
jgi:hypothetical protein